MLKEWTDVKRDRKLLLGSVLLPLVLLPLIGGILFAAAVTQPPVVEIINENVSNLKYVNYLVDYITSHGGLVYVNSSPVLPDVKVVFPSQFYYNITNINRTASVEITYLISANSQAFDLVENGLYNILYNSSLNRIEQIEKISNVSVPPQKIRDPLVVYIAYVQPTGKAASSSENNLAQLARIVAVILFPASTPVIFFVTDGILGEKERKTLESLLASPISAKSFIASKVAISMLLGIISSIGDVAGLVVFSLFAPFIVGASVSFSLSFVALTVVLYLLMVFLTASISVLILVLIGGSSKNVQIVNFVITSFGLVASFSSLLVNFGNLSFPLSTILLIPYVQIVASLLLYVFGLVQESIFYISGTIIACILLILISSRFLDSERLLLK
ncbi:MAG: Na+ efflux pump ABC transporter permease-like protein [Candidatus Aramenus sulfurataquae]|uniref:Na+ efflux pump ABC transporter permease-like protein n=1 Tax=Candidatus Aramenus sulfurataquae TaxID=1326980 RepID=W7L5M0_9CREN|nr:MAG: Na+ efflux pump ABC transporter permease-like protein [Candidatus Aramenus sulfurataquae]